LERIEFTPNILDTVGVAKGILEDLDPVNEILEFNGVILDVE
jgi:hypothetical protein